MYDCSRTNSDQIKFTTFAKDNGITFHVEIDNVKTLIDRQLTPASRVQKTVAGNITFTQYHTVQEIYAWLDELTVLYPNIVSSVNIGTTFEGRTIRGIVINYNADSSSDRPLTGILECGVHAREWISPATCLGVINEFLTSTHDDVRTLAERFVWHIFPIINPDGYAFTFSGNRMWRKNRNTNYYYEDCGDASVGVDLNRNFDFVWMSIGASANSCDETYAGPTAASEAETQALSSYVLQVNTQSDLIYYWAFHSFSQMVLVPYSHVEGYDKLLNPNYGDLYEIARRGADKLTAVHGTQYNVGTSIDLLYAVSGSSFDWAKGVVGVPVSFLTELRDVGEYGFLLPPEQIIPNNEEVIALLVEMDRVTQRLHYYYSSSSNMVLTSVWTIVNAVLVMLMK